MKIKFILNKILDFLYPPRCVLCDDILAFRSKGVVCDKCAPRIEVIKQLHRCEKCSRPIIGTKIKCKICSEQEFAFESGKVLYIYEGIVAESIRKFKYFNRKNHGIFYAEELVKHFEQDIKEWQIDIVIPVPMHKKRRKKRGYNQAEVMARALSNLLGLPYTNKILYRQKQTKAQNRLTPLQRRNNLTDAFSTRAPSSLKGKNVLLIDDIYTTGWTLHFCSKVLIDDAKVGRCYFLAPAIANKN